MNKRIIQAFVIMILLGVTNVHAKDLGVDFNLGYSAEAFEGFGGAFGFGLGTQYDLTKFSRKLDKFYGRFDINRYSYSEEIFGIELKASRMPFFLGARYMHSLKPVTIFGELGLELSFDSLEVATSATSLSSFDPITFLPIYSSTSMKAEASETNYGITPGVGVLYGITNKVYAGLNIRYHIISDAYLTIGIFAGYKFDV
jgi:opacity protein-like surface antigen